jgi:hypothetical protein
LTAAPYLGPVSLTMLSLGRRRDPLAAWDANQWHSTPDTPSHHLRPCPSSCHRRKSSSTTRDLDNLPDHPLLYLSTESYRLEATLVHPSTLPRFQLLLLLLQRRSESKGCVRQCQGVDVQA